MIDETQAAIQSLMGAPFLRELANKVRRGLSGVVRDGRHAGGRAYGYRPIPGEPGRLAIVADEAASSAASLPSSPTGGRPAPSREI